MFVLIANGQVEGAAAVAADNADGRGTPLSDGANCGPLSVAARLRDRSQATCRRNRRGELSGCHEHAPSCGQRREHVNAFVDADVRRKLERLARANDRTLSAEIRRALRAHVERTPTTRRTHEPILSSTGRKTYA